jgi:hypothetical protein
VGGVLGNAGRCQLRVDETKTVIAQWMLDHRPCLAVGRTRNERKRHNEPNTAVDDGKGFGVYVGDQ